jgi:hypothetical protein
MCPPALAPAWPLWLAAGLVPLAATLMAYAVAMHQGLAPACVPLLEGCTSISRAARHGLPNHLFRALMLPAAVLQAASWLLLALHLRARGVAAARCRALALLGAVAGAALVLYGAFLGTEGGIYRLLRQYGTVLYFGFTCICFLLAGGALELRAVAAIGVALVVLGLANAIVSPTLQEPWRDRLQNITEWWGALLFVAGFVLLAHWARRARIGLAVVAATTGGRAIPPA